jgi:cobalt-zinc-cadmium efflux system outer membrane protein
MLVRATWLLCLGLLFALVAKTVQAGTISISFDQLENIARAQSPDGKIIESQYRRTLAERDADLQWSNPEVAYDREDVDESKEYQVTLGKQFEFPWIHLKRRSSWSIRIRSAQFQQQQGMMDHLADLKAGYVAVNVHQQYLSRLQQLREILTDASQFAASRHTEGHLSGVEAHLIQMVVISMNASYQDALQLQREPLAEWQAALGYAADDSLVLESDVAYQPVELQSAAHYASLIESQPGLQARETLQKALSEQAAAERISFIPSINLYGGYKKIDPDLDGYVAGVSLSVPLFNRNGAASRKYEAESDIAAHETQLFRNQTTGRIEALVRSISGSQHMLATVADHFEEDQEALNSLLYSYEEGWMTLSELLNAIQIEIAGLKDYYAQMIRYYENLFELEAMTGETLVSF